MLGTADEVSYIRWGHEMDLLPTRYPWVQEDPQIYIDSYRYFYTTCKKSAPQAQFVWSPAGQEGLKRFYPGENFVDIVGLSVFGFPQWEVANGLNQLSFREVFQPKYDRIRQFNKPVMIAELGVTGSTDYKEKWLTHMRDDIESFRLVRFVVLFNAKDLSATWGDKVPVPDWRIEKDFTEQILFDDQFPTQIKRRLKGVLFSF